MNTVFCDSHTSELADALAPVMLSWVENLGWDQPMYTNRVVLEQPAVFGDAGTPWCLSSLWAMFTDGIRTQKEFDRLWTDYRDEPCPWEDRYL